MAILLLLSFLKFGVFFRPDQDVAGFLELELGPCSRSSKPRSTVDHAGMKDRLLFRRTLLAVKLSQVLQTGGIERIW